MKKIEIIANIDNKNSYKFEANYNITMRDVKKIIQTTADLDFFKINIKRGENDYTFSDTNLNILFPNENVIDLAFSTDSMKEEERNEYAYFNLGNFCYYHQNKFPYFYCFSCARSICSECAKSNDHQNHSIFDKHDYLQNSNTLVKDLLSDFDINHRPINFDDAKNNISLKFKEMEFTLKEIQNKIFESLETYKNAYESSFTNLKINVSLIKNHCETGINELKKLLHIQDIMLSDELFLAFDRRIKNIAEERSRICKDINDINDFYDNKEIVEVFYKSCEDLKDYLMRKLKANIFEDMEKKTKSSIIDTISKEEVHKNILSNVHDIATPIHHNKKPKEIIEDPKCLSQFSIKSDLGFNSELKPSKSIMKCIPDSNKISIFDYNTLEIKTKNVEISNLIIHGGKFLNNSATVNIGDSIYISGGENIVGGLSGSFGLSGSSESASTPTSLFLIYNSETNQLKRLNDMITPRHSHSILNHKEFLYAVGGHSTQSCERFSLKNYKWEELSKLNSEERQRPILYANSTNSGNTFLYAFFGYKVGKYLDSIERINLNSPKSLNSNAKWEIIPTIRNVFDVESMYMIGAGIVPVGKDEIILFGGKTKDITKKTAIRYNFSIYTLSDVTGFELEEPSFFNESSLIYLTDFIWGHFNEANDSILIVETIPH